jgi:protein SCO1
VKRRMLLGGATLALAAVVALVAVTRARGSDLPAFFQAPGFQLTDQAGRPFSSSELRGKPWVANFIYTRCRDSCPIITSNLERIRSQLRRQHLFPDRVRFVSISVDPTHDTPAVLTTFADKYGGARPSGWAFLTGDTTAITNVVLGFHMAIMRMDSAGVPDPHGTVISHSTSVLLIDGSGRVRARYSGTDVADLARLPDDLRRLE